MELTCVGPERATFRNRPILTVGARSAGDAHAGMGHYASWKRSIALLARLAGFIVFLYDSVKVCDNRCHILPTMHTQVYMVVNSLHSPYAETQRALHRTICHLSV